MSAEHERNKLAELEFKLANWDKIQMDNYMAGRPVEIRPPDGVLEIQRQRIKEAEEAERLEAEAWVARRQKQIEDEKRLNGVKAEIDKTCSRLAELCREEIEVLAAHGYRPGWGRELHLWPMLRAMGHIIKL